MKLEIKYGLDIIKEACYSWSLNTQDKHCKQWVSVESLKEYIEKEGLFKFLRELEETKK
jgi:hypothetical protein